MSAAGGAGEFGAGAFEADYEQGEQGGEAHAGTADDEGVGGFAVQKVFQDGAQQAGGDNLRPAQIRA
jgi:hypothetical protein